MKENWDNIYFAVLPLVGVVISTVGVAVGLLALKRSQAEAIGVGALEPTALSIGVNIPRVHYEDGQVLVQVREPGKWYELRDFVQPLNPEVARIVGGIVYG